jgi:hypothetical protein
LVAALRRSARGKGGRPPFDPVLMFKVLVLQALYSGLVTVLCRSPISLRHLGLECERADAAQI